MFQRRFLRSSMDSHLVLYGFVFMSWLARFQSAIFRTSWTPIDCTTFLEWVVWACLGTNYQSLSELLILHTPFVFQAFLPQPFHTVLEPRRFSHGSPGHRRQVPFEQVTDAVSAESVGGLKLLRTSKIFKILKLGQTNYRWLMEINGE